MKNISDKPLNRPTLYRHVRKFCGILGASFIIAGCSFPLESPSDLATDDDTYKAWKQAAANSSIAAPPAPDFSSLRNFHKEKAAALESAKPDPLPQIAIKNMVLSHEMDIGVLLRTLADAADLNVIISNNISGPVHVSLRHETRWDHLFLALTEARGIQYDLKDDILSIYSVQDIQDQIAIEQALHEQSQVAEKRKRSEPMAVEMIRIHYADLDSLTASVTATMQAVNEDQDLAGDSDGIEASGFTKASGFTIKADKNTGQVIIHGVPSDMAQARKLIQGLDQPSYQIQIEAVIVQANNEIARQLGVQWGVFDTSSDGEFNSNFPAGFDSSGTGFIYGLSRVRGTKLLQAQLSALQKDGRLNIVSRPSITTLDQMTAIIESGEERPFASSSGTGIGAVGQIEFKKATLRLEVTPQVIDTNWVKLNINTTKDDFDDTRSISIDGNLQTPILTRSAVTSLYLATGQTTVIGGLSSESNSLQEEGIPFLKNIPGLGAMFQNSSNRNYFSDTLIFLTPHILPSGQKPVNYDGK
ncbi:hypothetical protein N9F36_07810 [Akkermansiaceae bacterium]|nr:hypothetical protein [Akkermansiaceae bacterium]